MLSGVASLRGCVVARLALLDPAIDVDVALSTRVHGRAKEIS